MKLGSVGTRPLMERSFLDDIEVAFYVLVGATIGYVVFEKTTRVLVAAVAGLALGIGVLSAVRHIRRRRRGYRDGDRHASNLPGRPGGKKRATRGGRAAAPGIPPLVATRQRQRKKARIDASPRQQTSSCWRYGSVFLKRLVIIVVSVLAGFGSFAAAASAADPVVQTWELAGADPNDITVDEDGIAWFTDLSNNLIGRVDDKGNITSIPIPGPNAFPQGIASGPGHSIWFASQNQNYVRRYDTVTKQFDAPIPTAGARWVAVTPDGAVWFTLPQGDPRLGRIAPGASTPAYVALPAGAWANSLVPGPGEKVWYSDRARKAIGRIAPFKVGPSTKYVYEGETSTAGLTNAPPHGITVGPDGHVWFTLDNNVSPFGFEGIGRLAPAGGGSPTFSSFVSDPGPSDITPGGDGALWAALEGIKGFSRSAQDEALLTYPGLTPYNPYHVASSPDGSVWFTSQGGGIGAVGRLIPPPAPPTDCGDDLDNDGDGKVDYPDDPGCVTAQDASETGEAGALPRCSDGVDNDGDGKTDFPADSGCSSASDDDEGDGGPPPAKQCEDGKDNDGDGKVDYPADLGCVTAKDDSEVDVPNTPSRCDDDVDNDGDGKTDYPADPGCQTAQDNTEEDVPGAPARCDDDVDNDGDGKTDYPADPGCITAQDDTEEDSPGTLPRCSDGVDNDGDGKTDYPADPGCQTAQDNTEEDVPGAPARCNDGIDNDGDGKVDFPDDPGCQTAQDNTEEDVPGAPPRCDDDVDNDGDGRTDYPADPGCITAQDDSEADVPGALPRCSDGVDNDGDGKTDYPADPGCITAQDNFEEDTPGSPPRCNDGVDNDGDGQVDYPSDLGCTTAQDNFEEDTPGSPPRCNDGIDNDGDGKVDFPGDTGCSTAQDSTEEDTPGGPPRCNDDIDNDGDGKTDYPGDPGCVTAQDDSEADTPGAPPRCNDGVDNDGDGKTDYPGDPGCITAEDNFEEDTPGADPRCNDGVDNDGDGKIDYPGDLGCETINDNFEEDTPGAPPRCSDGIDNDGDGKTDHPADPGCSSPDDQDEADGPTPPAKQCGDGKDNDNDGKVDYPADPGCTSKDDDTEAPNPTPPPVPAACADGKDNDGDRKIDYPADPGCSSRTDTAEQNTTVLPNKCVTTLAKPGKPATISHPVQLDKLGTARFIGPASGLVIRTSTSAYGFQLTLKGKVPKGTKQVTFALDGKVIAKRKPRKRIKLTFKKLELQKLNAGTHTVVATLKMRKAVKLKKKRTKAVRLKSRVTVRDCSPPSLVVIQSKKRLKRPTKLKLSTTSGGPALSRATFKVGKALKVRRSKRWKRKAIGTLVLLQGNRKVLSGKLKAPKKIAKTLKFKLTGGVVVRWKARTIDVSGVPAGVTAVRVTLNGTRKAPAFINPARRAKLTHSVKLTDRANHAVTVKRSTVISSKGK